MVKLVAEGGINANGDINLAKKMIDIAALGGCDFIKWQKRDIDLVYTKEELDKYRESPWGTTNREQKMGLEFGKKEYNIIDSYCKQKNIRWFASPWDCNSVDFLMQYDCPFIKLASAMNTNTELIKKIKETGRPVIMSTGMSSEKEIDGVLEILGDQVEYILSCTSTYPTVPEDMNMGKIGALKELYGSKYKIGFSNHSPGICFISMAYALGAEMIEYHITLDRSSYGSDQSASIEPQGILRIKDYIDIMEKGWGDGRVMCLPNEIAVRDKLIK